MSHWRSESLIGMGERRKFHCNNCCPVSDQLFVNGIKYEGK